MAPKVDPALIEIHGESLSVRTDEVGFRRHKARATFVLVDVVNHADVAVDLTLAGALLDNDEKQVGALRKQWLRVPANGGRRTYALVDDQQMERPKAKRAEVSVTEVTQAVHAMGVVVEDGHVFDDRGRVVVTGYVVNKSERNASAVVIASFYNETGAPMERPSTHIRIDRGQKRGMQFVGPPGSTSATLYIGEVIF